MKPGKQGSLKRRLGQFAVFIFYFFIFFWKIYAKCYNLALNKKNK